MKMTKAFRHCTALWLAACLIAAPANAEEVRIIGKDGSIDLVGTLVSSQNRQITLDTQIGRVTVNLSDVICEGAACPAPPRIDFAFSVTGPADVAEILVPILFDGFAFGIDAEAIMQDAFGGAIDEGQFAAAIRSGDRVPVQIVSFDGEEVATIGVIESAGPQGFDRLATNDVSILFSDGTALPSDVQKVATAGGGNLESFEQEHIVAVDGLAIAVHPENSVPSISVAQAAGIFGGRITNWSRLGGADMPITIYAFAPDTAAAGDVTRFLLAPYGYSQSPNAKIVRSERDLVAALALDPSGIGLVSYHNKRGARVVPLASECGIVVEPSPFTIKTEEYPLEKRIVAYSRADTNGLARDFLNHLDGAELDGLVSKAGFVDLSVVPDGEAYHTARIDTATRAALGPGEGPTNAAMLREMGSSQRLSTTFRFAPGSSVLDNRARRDVARMVSYIGEASPTTVYVVGFADSAGAFSQNQALSQQRAQQVADQLIAAAGGALDGVDFQVRGYSELSPVACNETIEGRAINRRVEIWIE